MGKKTNRMTPHWLTSIKPYTFKDSLELQYTYNTKPNYTQSGKNN